MLEALNNRRKYPRHNKWRDAWIESDCIVIHCVPKEIKEYLLRDSKEDVEFSNNKYRELLSQREQQEESDRQRDEEEKKRIDDALDDLDL
jgi:hypothetical protein